MTDIWTLPNGLRVVGDPLEGLRTVSVGVWLHVGSMMEKPEENGLSHFLEHMAFKGTVTRTTRQIAEETDAIGGQINAFTARDCTCFYTKVIDEDLPAAIDLLSDLVLHPRFDPEELEKERGVILEEMAMDEDDPEDLVGEMMAAAQFGDLPAGRPIAGTADRVSAYSRETLIDFRTRHYAPDRTVVALSGRYDPKQVRALIQRHFGDWTNRTPQEPVLPQKPRTGIRMAKDKDIEQLHLTLGYPGYAYGEDEGIELVMLSTLFGGAMSSRLFQRVREELGMAYSIYSYQSAQEGHGAFHIYAGVSPRNAARVLAEIDRQRELLLMGGLTDKEFTEAKKQLRIGYLMGLESPSSRMSALGRRLLILGDLRDEDEVLRQIDAVTPEDVMRTARAVLEAPPCLTAVGNGAEEIVGGAL